MKIVEFFRLIWKHRRLLILTPLVLAGLVVLLTRNPKYSYSSETTLYTGMASAGGLDLFSSLNYYTSNTSFDNFINIVQSRETQKDIAIGLLAQHLLMEKANPSYISDASMNEFKQMIPNYIRVLAVENPIPDSTTMAVVDTMLIQVLPQGVSADSYRQTVANLNTCLQKSDTNFIYKLLHYNHPHYSLDAISHIQAIRLETSDMVRLRFESDDPGICRQTLALTAYYCANNYKKIKENRSESLIQYFESELKKASDNLLQKEKALLAFSETNNIIDFGEQTKTITTGRETLESQYNELKIKKAGAKAAIDRIEERLSNKGQLIVKSTLILQMRNRLSEVNSKIASIEAIEGRKSANQQLNSLKAESDKLKSDIEKTIGELHAANHTTEGLSTTRLLDEWIDNVLIYEETKAALKVQEEKMKDVEGKYESYAANGTDLKRLERDLVVAEQSYLKMLEGLNQAKIKIQDAEMSGSIKMVDAPYFPLNPNPTKRKILILAALFIGFFLVLTIILVLEYVDRSIKNPSVATKKTGLSVAGIIPRIGISSPFCDLDFIVNKSFERILLGIDLISAIEKSGNKPFILLVSSMLDKEGKSMFSANVTKWLNDSNIQTKYIRCMHDLKHCHSESTFKQSVLSKIFGYENRKIDTNHPTLFKAEQILDQTQYGVFSVKNAGFHATNLEQIMSEVSHMDVSSATCLIVEVPSLLNHPIPAKLLKQADDMLLICRSNREWEEADSVCLTQIEHLRSTKPWCVLNGVEPEVVEEMFGEQPKHKPAFHRIFKRLIRLQFSSKTEL